MPSLDHQQQQVQVQKENSPKTQSRNVKPDVIEKTLSLPRTSSNSNYYPPQIAQFMSRVRNRSTDAGDPTQTRNKGTAREEPAETRQHSHTRTEEGKGAANAQPQVYSSEQNANKSNIRTSPEGLYDVPRHAIKRDLASADARDRTLHARTSNSGRTGGPGQVAPKSFSMPRGQFTPAMVQQYAHDSSRETTPNSAHTQSDIGELSQGDGLQSAPKNPRSMNPKHSDVTRTQSLGQRPPFAMRTSHGPDSIPNSPTYFTVNHPHRDEATPSPDTQLINKSFQEHLNSLHPNKPPKGVHVMDWMHKSSQFWSYDSSFPMVIDPEANTPQKLQPRVTHFYEQLSNPPLTSQAQMQAPVTSTSEETSKLQRYPQHQGALRVQRAPLQPNIKSFTSSEPRHWMHAFSPHISTSASPLNKDKGKHPVSQKPSNGAAPTYPVATEGDDFYILDV